jgi:hypothetical protein
VEPAGAGVADDESWHVHLVALLDLFKGKGSSCTVRAVHLVNMPHVAGGFGHFLALGWDFDACSVIGMLEFNLESTGQHVSRWSGKDAAKHLACVEPPGLGRLSVWGQWMLFG